MYIQNNISAANALNNLGSTEVQLTSSIQKLSSGFRLNRAGDDAAGMSIANSLRNNLSGLLSAQQNASQAGSILQIADGATQTISTILDRMKQLATQSASANLTDADRQKVQAEFKSLQDEIDRTVGSTVYQGKTLLGGSFGSTFDTNTTNSTITVATSSSPAGASNISVGGAPASSTFTLVYTTGKLTATDAKGNVQVVATADGGTGIIQNFNFDKLGFSFTYNGSVSTDFASSGKTISTTSNAAAAFRVGSGGGSSDTISLTLGNLGTTGLGLGSTVSVGDAASAATALTAIDSAVSTLSSTIGTIGAAESRLGYATTNLNSLYQNVSAAESVIRDTDMAQEYTKYSKLQIMQQAGTAMLAQANSSQQSVLRLFQ